MYRSLCTNLDEEEDSIPMAQLLEMAPHDDHPINILGEETINDFLKKMLD